MPINQEIENSECMQTAFPTKRSKLCLFYDTVPMTALRISMYLKHCLRKETQTYQLYPIGMG